MKPSLKNMPKLKLVELLRRRKMSLRQLLDEFGITTYDGLLARCHRLGVMPPDESEFKLAMPNTQVNNPSEGVVVFDLLDRTELHQILKEQQVHDDIHDTYPPIMYGPGCVDDFQLVPKLSQLEVEPSAEPTEPTQKKLRKKKEVS